MPPAIVKDSQGINTQFASRSARILLAVWGWGEPAVLKGKLTDRLKRKGEKSSDYKDVFTQLENENAITYIDGKVAISSKGIERLGEHLQNADLAIEGTVVGAWVAKALHQWIQQSVSTVGVATAIETTNGETNGKAASSAIASYAEFQPVVLEVFDRLSRDYNMGNMVPIYRIRREIGDRVSRSQFNEWLFEMQSKSLLELLEESVEDAAPDKIEDSVTTKLGKLRCYAKR